MGRFIYNTFGILQNREPIRYLVTLGRRTEQNPYAAELAAMAMVVKLLPLDIIGRQITMFTSNQAALLATSQPPQQPGQASIREIYNAARALRQRGNRVRIVWVPSHRDFELSRKAKEAARQATEQDQEPQEQFP